MICPRCGRKNQTNVNRCVYCGTPLYAKKKKKKYDTADKVIFSSIVALFLALVILITYAASSFSPYKKSGIVSWDGPPLVINDSVNRGVGEVTLDSDDPDYEIYSFDADKREILIGSIEETIFTARIFSENIINDNDVAVYDDRQTLIGYMNDKGENGDAAASDGIYTLSANLSSEVRVSRSFTCRVDDYVSNPLKIYFYRIITDEELGNMRDVIDAFINIQTPQAAIEYLSSNENVEFYKASDDMSTVSYTMKSGISGIWEEEKQSSDGVQFKGASSVSADINYLADYTSANTSVSESLLFPVYSKTDVCVVRPFRNSQFTYDDFLHAGNLITRATGGETDTFDDGRANLEVFKSFGDYGVVLIDSHGTISHNRSNSSANDLDPYIVTTSNFRTDTHYSDADWQDGRIVVMDDGSIAVGAGFFDRYYSDNSLDGTAFYLGTCYSMYDNTLANVLINKGAEVVYGFTDKVRVDYCNDVLYELVANQHILSVETADDAFANTVQKCGATSYGNAKCRFDMAGNDRYQMVSDIARGKISGSVTDSATGEPVKDVYIRVFKDGYPLTYGKTGSNGQYEFDLNEGSYVLRFDHMNYKPEKVGAEVAFNTTTYIETLMLITRNVSDGIATGTVTNAVTGESVPGAQLRLRNSWNNRTGKVISTTTSDAQGCYEFSGKPGYYTVEFSKDGFITGYRNIIINVADFYAQNIAISPEMPDDGEFVIVLSWANKPSDLDAHLTGPVGNGDNFHLYFHYADDSGNNNPYSDYFRLDLDNTDIVRNPTIPETVTIVKQLDGVYTYAVHDFTNRDNFYSSALSESGATVNVYKGGVPIATYHVPANKTGTVWTVFEISGNEIIPVNSFGNDL